MKKKNQQTPWKICCTNILFLVGVLFIPYVFAANSGQLGALVNISVPTNSTPVILNVTINMTNINSNYSYIWVVNFSDNLSDIFYWNHTWGTFWSLDNGTLIYASNNTIIVNTTHMDFPIDDNVTIRDKYSSSDIQLLNFTLSNSSYTGNWTGSNHTQQYVYYNITMNNRGTDAINTIWRLENISGGILIQGGFGETNNLVGDEINQSVWRGDWITETWDYAENTSSITASLDHYCWSMPFVLTSDVINIDYPNLNWTLDMDGANFTSNGCSVVATSLINYTHPTDTVYANFSTPGVDMNNTLVTNGTFVYPTYNQTRHEREVAIAYPDGVNTTFLANNYVNISVIIEIEDRNQWNLFEWDGLDWVEGNCSGVDFIVNSSHASWNALNLSGGNKTYRVVGVTGGEVTVVPSPGGPSGGGPMPQPYAPNPNFRIAPRTVDPVLGNIIEPFHSYGNACKRYSVKNIGTTGGLLTLSKYGYTYQLSSGMSVNSVSLFSVDADEIYLLPNATSSFQICVDIPESMMESYDAYVVARGGDVSEKIMVFMNPPMQEYIEGSIMDYLMLALWESPRPVGTSYIILRVWHLSLILLFIFMFSGATYVIRRRSAGYITA